MKDSTSGPHDVYEGKGWVSMPDWLGYEGRQQCAAPIAAAAPKRKTGGGGKKGGKKRRKAAAP